MLWQGDETLPLAGLGRAAERGNTLAHRVGVCKRGFNAPCFEMIVTMVCLSFDPAREYMYGSFDVTQAYCLVLSERRCIVLVAYCESLLLVQVIRAGRGNCSIAYTVSTQLEDTTACEG